MKNKTILILILLMLGNMLTYPEAGADWQVVSDKSLSKESFLFDSDKSKNLLVDVKEELLASIGKDEEGSLNAPPPGVTDKPQKVPFDRDDRVIYIFLSFYGLYIYNEKRKKKMKIN
ncbi:MAG: hypothetical protein LUG18_15750 [Candidatus Azobacteroides sp.]|nr:hypothetical protein [Candidatus Azobacteroides sp.]